MIRAENAIARITRDLTISLLVKVLLAAGVFVSIVLETFNWPAAPGGSVLLFAIAIIWMVLSFRSVRGSRSVALSPALIASGRFEQAEHYLAEALRNFSLFRTVKLRTLHHLAVLRHAQRQWDQAAILSRALLNQRLGPLGSLARSARLILAESSLEVGDLRGAYESLLALYNQRLPLNEAMELAVIQADYLSRVGGWQQMMDGVAQTSQLADLMETQRSVRLLSLLALAARKTGRSDWENWLRRRAELIADVLELVAQRPALAEIWPA